MKAGVPVGAISINNNNNSIDIIPKEMLSYQHKTKGKNKSEQGKIQVIKRFLQKQLAKFHSKNNSLPPSK